MPTNKLRLLVNDIDFSDLLVDAVSGRSATLVAMLEAALNKESSRLQYLDLRGRVILETIQGDEVVRAFTGYVVQAGEGETSYRLSGTDPRCILQDEQTGGALGRGLLPGEIIYYLIEDTMPQSADKAMIHTGVGGTVADADWVFRSRRYVFIAPFPCCTLELPEIELADATLYVADSGGSEDDQIIARGLPTDVPPEWGDGRTRVRFYVRAEGFLDAFQKGQDRLRRLVDYVSFAANLSTPSYRSGNKQQYHTFERSRIITDFSESRWAYVRDTVPRPDRYWLRWFAPHRSQRSITLREDDPLVKLYSLFQQLMGEEDERLTRSQRALLSAIHALRRSRQAPYTLDALHHLWQCVEFLVGGNTLPELFTKNDRRALGKAARCLMRRRYEEGNPSERQKREKRIDNMLARLNDLPLQGKWQVFCEEHGLEFPQEDLDFLWKTMRPIRNNDVHGNTATVDRAYVDRAAVILEKAVIAAVEASNRQR